MMREVDACEAIAEGSGPPFAVFPEGTVTNGKGVLEFKNGTHF